MLTLLLLTPAFAGCPGDAGAAWPQIDARNTAAVTALAAGDLDGYVDVFAQDGMQISPGSAPLVGRDAIRESWAGALGIGRWTFDLETTELWACGGTAVERGAGSLSYEPGENAPPGMGAFVATASYVAHWIVDEDGVWRIRSEAAVAPE